MKKLFRVIAVLTVVLSLFACSSSNTPSEETGADKKIVVGCNPVPMVDILNAAKPVLEKDGYELEIVEFTDYVLPNTSLESGEIDANYFQTLGYMNDQNSTNGLHLAAVGGVHIEPMGIYSQKVKDISELGEGSVVGVPNDADNEDRALQVLIAAGLLNDPHKNGYLDENDFNGNATTNPKGLVISPIEAANLPNNLPDVDAAVINGNYALGAGLPSTYPAIFVEVFDEETSIRRTNFIVVKEGNEASEKTQALVKAIQSDEVAKFIESNYKGSVIQSFLSQEDIK